MPDAPKDFSTTPDSNSTVNGINIAEGSSAAQLNDAIRATLAVVANPDFGTGSGFKVDAIAESTAAAGVTIDGLLIKDGALPDFIAGVPIGTILDYAGDTAPTGYLDCDGSAVSRATYADLFTAIGTNWGTGDGSTTFNIPDFRGRTAIGSGTGSGLTERTLGESDGEEEHDLTVAEMPTHSHSLSSSAQVQGAGTAHGDASPATRGTISNTNTAGSGDPHNNMQPFAVVTKIIRAL